MFLVDSIHHYINNFKAVAAFLILLIFVFIFIQFPNAFLSSGNVFLEYGNNQTPLIILAVEFISLLLFVLFYSIFVTIIVFGVRKELSHVRLWYYLQEMIHKFSFKIFVLYLAFFLISLILSLALISSNLIPFTQAILLSNMLMLVLSLLLLFVPQAIVVDEENLVHSIKNNFDFIVKNPLQTILVIVLSIILVGVIPFIEMFFDSFQFSGRFVSLVLMLLFVIPFIEIVKTHFYMLRIELVKSSHHARKMHSNYSKEFEQALREKEEKMKDVKPMIKNRGKEEN